MKVFLLIFLLTLNTGGCPLTYKEEYVRSGDMLALYCGDERCTNSDSVTLWKKETDEETFLFNNMSAAEQKQMGVLVSENCFVILNASVNHQGNYSCDSRRLAKTASMHMRFMVTVYTSGSKEYEKRNQYPMPCYKKQSCTLNCPHDLPEDAPNITNRGITWKKDGKPSPSYFPSVEEKDSGVYTCKRSYLYSGQIYNMTFTVPLTVTEETVKEPSRIILPKDGDIFQVELDKTLEMNCEAVTDSCDNLLFWLIGDLFPEDNNSTNVLNNSTCNTETKRMRASLVFREVSEEDLSKNYTCKLQCDDPQPSQNPKLWVTVTLTQNAHTSHSSLAVCVVVIVVVVMAVAFLIYVKFKDGIILFLRNASDRRRSASALHILHQNPTY